MVSNVAGEHTTRLGKVKFDSLEALSPQVLSRLVHKFGHEVGNPLTSLISLASILERFPTVQGSAQQGAVGQKVPSYARSIISEAWRVSLLTEKLVLLLSDKHGSPSPCNIAKCIERTLSRMKTRQGVDTDFIQLCLPGDAGLSAAIDQDQFMVLLSE